MYISSLGFWVLGLSIYGVGWNGRENGYYQNGESDGKEAEQ